MTAWTAKEMADLQTGTRAAVRGFVAGTCCPRLTSFLAWPALRECPPNMDKRWDAITARVQTRTKAQVMSKVKVRAGRRCGSSLLATADGSATLVTQKLQLQLKDK
jgi:hypothetical protein